MNKGQNTLQDIASLLKTELDSLAESAARNIYEELPDYATIAKHDLMSSTRANINRGVTSLIQRKVPGPEEVAEPQHTTRRRMSQGMPIDAIIRAYRLNLTTIHERFIQLATASGLPTSETLLGSNLLWQLGDWFMDRAVLEYRSYAVTEAVRRRVEKGELLRALGDSETDPRLTTRRAVSLGLREDISYRVIMSATEHRAEWVDIIEQQFFSSADGAIAADIGKFAVGVIPSLDRLSLSNYSIAAGPVVRLGNLHQSWRLAKMVLDAIPTSVVDGCWHDVESLSWKLAVPGSSVVNELLRSRYMDPLSQQGEYGKHIFDSVRFFIDHGFSVKKAAKALFIHQNSLRHRLRRFEEITGTNLARIDTLVEIEWLGHLLSLSILRFDEGLDARSVSSRGHL